MPKVLAMVAIAVSLICSCKCAKGAMQLVSYDSSGKYHLHESALRDIEKLPSPVRVLAAIGDARIGKSTFLNMVDFHWDQTLPETRNACIPFEISDTAQPCTRGVWVHASPLPESGSLVLVDVEGDNLGNDAVTKQLSALTAVVSSYILLFVREVVNNAALEFLYHTTKLGKMFPDSDSFPHLGVAIRDALDLSPNFTDKHREVVHFITSPTYRDGNDELRSEIKAVFSPWEVTVFEVEYQNRTELKNLQALKTGAYYDSVQKILSDLKETVPAKLTPSGMTMCGVDLVEIIRKLFIALENGNITVLETAYEKLEKQMCDSYYSELIKPLWEENEEDFMSTAQNHFDKFKELCKIDSYNSNVWQEINRVRQERERRQKAEKEAEARLREKEEELREVKRERERAEEQLKWLQQMQEFQGEFLTNIIEAVSSFVGSLQYLVGSSFIIIVCIITGFIIVGIIIWYKCMARPWH